MKKVLVGGAFDLFHYGHLCMLEWAKSHGDYLVVHVSTDERVKFKKGEGRPVVPQRERIAIVKACRFVDEICVIEYPYKTNPILKALKNVVPDIYCRDAEANLQTLEQERKLCKKLGIKIIFYKNFPHFSSSIHTTGIIGKIRGRRRINNFVFEQ